MYLQRQPRAPPTAPPQPPSKVYLCPPGPGMPLPPRRRSAPRSRPRGTGPTPARLPAGGGAAPPAAGGGRLGTLRGAARPRTPPPPREPRPSAAASSARAARHCHCARWGLKSPRVAETESTGHWRGSRGKSREMQAPGTSFLVGTA